VTLRRLLLFATMLLLGCGAGDMRFRVRIGVDGFTEAEIQEGLSHLLGYLQERPWLLDPNVDWDAGTKRLLVAITVEAKRQEVGGRKRVR
jgi:hypothetical protein